MDEQVLLTDSERDYFRKMESMFASDGWELIVEELREDLETLPVRTFRNARDWNEVLAGRAAETKLAELLSYPDIIEQRKQHLMEERRQEAEEALLANRPDV